MQRWADGGNQSFRAQGVNAISLTDGLQAVTAKTERLGRQVVGRCRLGAALGLRHGSFGLGPTRQGVSFARSDADSLMRMPTPLQRASAQSTLAGLSARFTAVRLQMAELLDGSGAAS